MPEQFRGAALPLDEEGFFEVIDKMGIGPAELWAALNVETRGCGFMQDRRPFILYERHIFSRETLHKYDAAYPDISNKEAGGYGAGGDNQYQRLVRAIALDRKAALDSTSWGIGQVMGFNAEIAGYADVEAMVSEMMISERNQLVAMAGEITHNKLERALKAHDWAAFARGYNGSAYAKNHYDTRLAAAYQKYSIGPLPDLVVRAAQMFLTYLGYNPGSVDGLMGRFTRSALNEFQQKMGLSITEDIDKEVLSPLALEVEKLDL
jgi:hypothetical protein